MRIPALEIEASVVQAVGEALDDPLGLLARAGIPLVSDRLRSIMRQAEQLAASVRRKQRDAVRALVATVAAEPRQLTIALSVSGLCSRLGIAPPPDHIATIELTMPIRLTRSGQALRLVQQDGRAVTQGKPDPGLVAMLRKARSWWQQLQTGETDIATIAREEKISDSWVSRMVRLNFLAPAIVEAILAGSQPARVSTTSLRAVDLPIDWNAQTAMFGI